MSLTSSLLTLAVAVLLTVSATLAQEAPKFDFTQAPDRQGWQAAHDVGPLEGNAAGLVVSITGSDPYIIGPARDYPAGVPLWLHLRLKSEQAGTGQVFYFHDAPTEENSVHFPAQAGVWQEVRLPLPALGPGYHLRLDPPGTSGQAIISSIRSEPRVLLQEPTWPAPITPLCLSPTGKTLSLQSSELSLIHGTGGLGDFRVNVAGKPMAAGFHHFLIGYMMGKTVRWIDALNATQNSRAPEIRATRRSLQAITNLRDPDGALWQFRQNFTPGKITGTIDVVTEVTVDHDREVVFLPMFMLLPGVQSFGESKGQGLFAGLEYLDNEPSSSEADIIGPASRRQVPDSLKITLPLMAIQADNRYVGLSWEAQPTFSAVFDSPDRLFKSQGHVMGVLFPGSDGTNRVEGNLLPYQGELLKSKRPLTLRATIMGGRGNSVISAMQQYVQMRGLPPVPNIGMSQQDYVALAAGGWLDSKIREGDTFRHAYWPGFEPHPAADAPMLMEWLAHQTTDAQLAARLHQVAQSALAKVGPQDYNFAAISHVTYPAPALIYGYVEENAARAEESARNTLKQFT
ncbi:MAG: hypothetical protein JOZ57_04395, partial [Abitibacteriaceae bacterium]|nr:hypothetical protein [Abditibacteriaceae bacterium]